MREYIEKVATGIRMMEQKPDAFLFCGDSETTWDEPTILGIPVFHSVFVQNTFKDNGTPFIPLWRTDGEYSLSRKQFEDGFVG